MWKCAVESQREFSTRIPVITLCVEHKHHFRTVKYMERAFSHHHCLRRSEAPHTPSLAKHRSEPENVQNHVGLPTPMKSLNLRRLSPNRITIHRFQFPKLFCLNSPKKMAEEAKIKNQPHESSTENRENKKKEEEPAVTAAPPPPPPPEKPLPGDCCGSGCVRCVWDVYYEELEAYDNLYKK
ncbi:hypothetical protein L1049_003481 [Liquidambar formosana]|uniref:Oxidoreductase-like domain-containing protein n=1 Tax=Liquidambar formosana TaxID=63359 RepID=A0AAP0N586_LIQFO